MEPNLHFPICPHDEPLTKSIVPSTSGVFINLAVISNYVCKLIFKIKKNLPSISICHIPDVCTKRKSRQTLLFVQSEQNNVQHFQHESLNIRSCIQHYDIISHHCTDKKKASAGSHKLRYLKR